MESVLYNISQVLGISIIHSLWQGLIVYSLLRIALMFSPNLQPAIKYRIAVCSMVFTTVWFFYTLVNEIHLYNWLAAMPTKITDIPLLLQLPIGVHQFNDVQIRHYYSIERYLPYISAIYIVGLVFNAIKLIISRKKITLIKKTMSIDLAAQYLVNAFCHQLRICKKVSVGLSKLVDVPCLVGYLKPVILLPFSLSTYLSAEEIEAILLHELAHLKRNDYLVNLLQQVIAILLFFNPCIMLISRIINEERENCCDDLVVKATATPIIYAKALLKLEQNRQNDWKLALAATGKKYHLLNRIERIMKTKKQNQSLRPALMAVLILTVGIGFITILNPEIARGTVSVKAVSRSVVQNILLPATPVDTGNKTTAKKQRTSANHVGQKHHGNSTTQLKDDKKLTELSEEIKMRSDALNKYYGSDEFKNTQREMEKNGRKMQELYNTPELKKLQAEMQQAGADFAKDYRQDDKTQQLSKEMGEKGREIGAYYKSPSFKQMNEELEKKYGIKHNGDYYNNQHDENYKKYQAELDSKIPDNVKLSQKQLNEMGQEIGARYNSPEFKARSQRLQALGDSLKLIYEGTAMKQQKEYMDQLGRQMSAMQNDPQFKKQQVLLQQSIKKMEVYLKSAEYKNSMDQLKKLKFNYDFNFNEDNKKAEEAEKQEKAEQQEKVEKPEAPEHQ